MAAGDTDKEKEAGFGARFMTGLKDLILEEETPNQAKPEEKAPDASRSKTRAQPPADFSGLTTSQPITASSSPMTAHLLEQVLSRATAYTALNDAIKPLEEIIPDEMTRYRAAFAVIKKNRSLDQVIQAIDMQHMQAVDDEVARFAAQAKQKEVTDINARVTEAQTLKDNVDAAGVQITKLREETENRIRVVEDAVQRDRARLDEIERELLEKRQAIALIETQFNSAVASVKDTLTQNKAKIVRYLAP